MYESRPSMHRQIGLLVIQAVCLVSLSLNSAGAQEYQNSIGASSQRQAPESYREASSTTQGAPTRMGAADRTKLVLNEVPTTTSSAQAEAPKSRPHRAKKNNFDDNFSSLDGNMPVGGI